MKEKHRRKHLKRTGDAFSFLYYLLLGGLVYAK
jgi:hypothetical protein